MAREKLSKQTVDAATPTARDEFIWDREVPGFGLKVTPAGAKVYVYQYRIARPGAAERTPARRYTIGRHGNLTPDQARKRAKELATQVEHGVDPRDRELQDLAARDEGERRARERALIDTELAFSKVANRWLDHYENEKARRPSSVRLAKLVVNRHLKPVLADKPIPHITRADLQPILDGIPIRQKGIRRAVFAYASVLFGWAAKRGDIASNPLAEMVKPMAPKGRDRVLTDEELAEVWKASARLGQRFGPFFRLLILTGQRRSEVAELTWSELDRPNTTWTIPGSRAKNGTAHIVPLSALAMAELDGLAEVQGKADERLWPKDGYVLTTNGRRPISGISKAKRALDRAIVEARESQAENARPARPLIAWRVHDLRRTFATGFQRMNIRFEVTEAALNHVSGAKGGVAGIYQRHDWKEEKRAALEAWGRHLLSILDRGAPNHVVSLEAFRRSA